MINISDRVRIVNLIQETRLQGARLKPICKEVGISIRTYERWVLEGEVKEDKRPNAQRPAPKNKLSKEEHAAVLRVVNLPQYADLPPSQIVPHLADRGLYLASESTIYRILREEQMQNHRGRSKSPEKSKAPTTHIAKSANEVWTWDITYLNTSVRGLYYKLYMIIDIFSRKIVGWEVWENETGEHACELVEKAVLSEKTKGMPLVLHSDNGSPMKASNLKAKLEMLGIMASYSRPRVSNDNPYSEALFRTCKYRPDYPYEGFKTMDEARKWVMKFVEWYNNRHYHSGLNFITPNTRHNGTAEQIMEKRKSVYNTARELHPERWAREIRNWELEETVALNPTDEVEKKLRYIG